MKEKKPNIARVRNEIKLKKFIFKLEKEKKDGKAGN